MHGVQDLNFGDMLSPLYLLRYAGHIKQPVSRVAIYSCPFEGIGIEEQKMLIQRMINPSVLIIFLATETCAVHRFLSKANHNTGDNRVTS